MAEAKQSPEPWNEGRPPLLRTPTPGQDVTRVLFPLSKMPESTVPMETMVYGTPGGIWIGMAVAVLSVILGFAAGAFVMWGLR